MKNWSIVVAADPIAVSANVDPVILRLALVNLVDNAIRYSPAGGRIDLAVGNGGKNGENEATIDVRDQGPGVLPIHQQRIFERFYRVTEARSRQDGGAGLGLAIARWAVPGPRRPARKGSSASRASGVYSGSGFR